MGIILKQSSTNILSLLLGIGVGAVNTLFLYVYFLEESYYGLVTFLLSSAFIIKPLMALGVNYSIIKFFSSIKNVKQKDVFLSMALWFPLVIMIPFSLLVWLFYQPIVELLSAENQIVSEYVYLILGIGLVSAYFEVFYAWSKVHLTTVFGHFLKELFVRLCAMVLLVLVGFKIINQHQFIYAISGAYLLQALLMMAFAFKCYLPKFRFELPENFKEIIRYSFYILLAGASATILLDIDKFMIPQKELIEEVAYYAVAVYIGSVIEMPGKALAQIVQPLTAKAINEGKMDEVANLYHKSSVNLLIMSGLLFVLINSNITDLFKMLPQKYAGGGLIVLMISIAKLYHMFLGNNGSIISNSKYYRVLLPYGIAMAVAIITLNHFLIDGLGINGAALATLIVVVFFNSFKLAFVKYKFGLLPTSDKTWKLLLLITSLTVIGIYIKLSILPIIAIALKTLVISLIYIYIVLKLNLSAELDALYIKYLRKS